MNTRMQIYYNGVFGGLGGLIGWWTLGSLGSGSWNIWLASIVIGGGIGAAIGALVASMEGAMIKRSPLRALRDAASGALAGLIGGVLGLVLGQSGFLLLGGGFAGRPLGWMLLGCFVGLGELVVSRRLRRASYGAIGGLIGGFIGGLIYEGLTQAFIDQSDLVQSWVGGIGLVLMGACIGALIALTRKVLSRGELRVLNGRREGTTREITDLLTLGSSDGCDVYLPDRAIARQHVRVRRTRDGFSATLDPEADSPAVVAGRPLLRNEERPLRAGDVIQIGETRVQLVAR